MGFFFRKKSACINAINKTLKNLKYIKIYVPLKHIRDCEFTRLCSALFKRKEFRQINAIYTVDSDSILLIILD